MGLMGIKKSVPKKMDLTVGQRCNACRKASISSLTSEQALKKMDVIGVVDDVVVVVVVVVADVDGDKDSCC